LSRRVFPVGLIFIDFSEPDRDEDFQDFYMESRDIYIEMFRQEPKPFSIPVRYCINMFSVYSAFCHQSCSLNASHKYTDW